MSVQAISWVLEHSPARGTARLVLIALANHAGANPNNDGKWECYPSVETIGREAGVDNVRTVQYALSRLEKTGQIERVLQAAPDARIRGDKKPNLYRVLTRPTDGTQHPVHTHPVANPRRARGATPATPQPPNGVQTPAPRATQRGANPRTPAPVDNPTNGVQENGPPYDPRGATRLRHGVQPVAPKPSENRSVETKPTSDPPPSAPPVDEPPDPTADAKRRLHELMTRRADRPTRTTGMRTARDALRPNLGGTR